MRLKKRLTAYAGVVLLALATYSSSLGAGYHADDWAHQYVPRAFTGPADLFSPPEPFDTSFRPVFLAHLWLLSKISDLSIPVARLWTILIHAFSGILVFEIARRFLPKDSTRGALIAAVWFSVGFCHFEVPNALTNSETPGVILLLLSVFLLSRRWPTPSWAECLCVLLAWGLSVICISMRFHSEISYS